MLGKRLINTGGAGACTTDTVQILDPGSTQSTALYRFEDNANDTAYTAGTTVSSYKIIDLDVNGYSSGATISNSASNTDDATKYGTATYSNPSGSNGRFDLDGASDYLQIDANTTFNGATNYTLEGWFKPDNLTAVDHLFAIHDGSSGSKFYARLNDAQGDIDAMVYGSTGTGSVAASIVTSNTAVRLQANVFNHFVMTYTDGSGGLLSIYINGVLAGSAAATGNGNTTGTADLLIGSLGGYIGAYDFDGEVGQVRFYISALSATEVLQNYNATRALYGAYDGTNVTDITYNSSGKFGKSAIFNGTSSYFKLPFSTLGNNPFTISMWLKFDDLTSERYIFSKYPGSGGYGMLCQSPANASTITLTAYNTSNSPHIVTTTTSMSTGTWYNYVITFDFTSSIKAYLNGSQEATVTTSGSFAQNSDTVYIGRYHAGATYFDGEMDQIRVFDKVLNAGEINSLYNETATSAASGTIDNPSTVAYYKMADATDETGSYNGTPSNVDFNVQGKYGFAGKFNGSNAYIDLPLSTSLLFGGKNTLAVSFWFKTTTTARQRMFTDYAQTSRNCDIVIDSGNIEITTDYNQSTNLVYTSSSTYNDGNWHHLVVAFNQSSSQRTIYVDGSLVNTGTLSANSWSGSGQKVTLGAFYSSSSGYSQYFDGSIDQVRIFNKAISASEVTKLYNEVQCANTITAPESYFNTKLYSGNGGTQSITGVGFQPDLVWIKSRDSISDHDWIDAVRGATKVLESSGTYAESTESGNLTSFDTDGFTVGNVLRVNKSGDDFVAWNWKAASSNTTNNDGTIQSTVRASQESGFSIVSYTANGTAGTTIGHGLSQAPQLIIVKHRNGTSNWPVYATGLSAASKYLYLNTTGAETSSSNPDEFHSTVPTSSVFSIGVSGNTNTNNGNYIAYCFANVDGYQRIGSYIGNGSSNNGTFVYTGFEPAFLMIKRTDSSANWRILDNKRSSSNPRDKELYPNLTNAEGDYDAIDFLSNGFQNISTDSSYNANNGKYLFLAIAANPDTTAPTKANSFSIATYTGNRPNTQSITGVGFKPDLVWIKNRDDGNYPNVLTDSVRGNTKYLQSDSTQTEQTTTTGITSFDSDGFSLGANGYFNGGASGANNDMVAWAWKGLDHDRNLAAINTNGSITSLVSANPSAGFSIVKFTTNLSSGQSTTVGHGLSAAPEIIIQKNLGNSYNWWVSIDGISGFSQDDYLSLNQTAAKTNISQPFGRATSTVFSVSEAFMGSGTQNSIAYCWYSVTGHSKIGSYLGTGGSISAINVGFQPRFVMIKSTGNTSGNWAILDSLREGTSKHQLSANDSHAEYTNQGVTFTSTGFSPRQSVSSDTNTSGITYIYMAFK